MHARLVQLASCDRLEASIASASNRVVAHSSHPSQQGLTSFAAGGAAPHGRPRDCVVRVTNEQWEQAAEGLGVPPEEDDDYMELSQLQVRCAPASPHPCPP